MTDVQVIFSWILSWLLGLMFSVVWNASNNACVVKTRQFYITLRPRCALPSPPSRLIPFAANAMVTKWSLLLHNVIGDWIIPFAASALQCVVHGEGKPQNCSLVFRHHAGEGPSHGHRQHAQKNWWRLLMLFWRYSRGQTDRCTHHNTLPPLLLPPFPQIDIIGDVVIVWG